MQVEYQVFISYKYSDSNGLPTRDSELAGLVYSHLKARNIEAFISHESLRQLGVGAYKRAIDKALDSSQILVAVGTSHEYLDSQWVRYEWDSFFNDILSDIKPNGRLFSYIEGAKIADLPRTLRQNQIIKHGDNSLAELSEFIINALQDTLRTRPLPSTAKKAKRPDDFRQNTLLENPIDSYTIEGLTSCGKLSSRLISKDISLHDIESIKLHSKRSAKKASSRENREAASIIYYASIASALLNHDYEISKIPLIDLEKAFGTLAGNDWIDDNLIDLFIKAQQACARLIEST